MRKATLLVTLFIFLSHFSNAQEENSSRNYFTGGSFHFSYQDSKNKNDNTDNTTNDELRFWFLPYIGKEISPKLSIGIQLEYQYNLVSQKINSINQNNDDLKTNTFGIGLFSRHIVNPSKKFNFFLQPNLRYSHRRTNGVFNATFATFGNLDNQIDARIDFGILYNINAKFRATLSSGGIGYYYRLSEITDSDNRIITNAFNLNMNSKNLFLGFEYRF